MTKVKCANCGTKFEVDVLIVDDLGHPLECPDCNFAASFWNFDVELPPEDYEDKEDE